ncbi:sugar nucleotide-binding protein [bacterium]|nr:sugar nucleotide-binding protein [bacterium]
MTGRNRERVLVLGAKGWVGGRFVSYLKTIGLDVVGGSRSDLDYYDPEVLRSFIQREKIGFLVNCGGYTGKPNVDACELHKAECLSGNAVLPGRIRQACEEAAIPWGHVSSGCIYSGDGPHGDGFKEADIPNFSFRSGNCSFYSGTKALGEEMLEGAENCFVWRLRIPFDHIDSPRNFLTKLMTYKKLLIARNSLSHLDDFVESAWACWHEKIEFGTYNLTNPGSVTTEEVVQLIKAAGLSNKEFEYFEDEEDFMKIAAKTPRSNCVLDSTKAIGVGLPLRPVGEALKASLTNWKRMGERP